MLDLRSRPIVGPLLAALMMATVLVVAPRAATAVGPYDIVVVTGVTPTTGGDTNLVDRLTGQGHAVTVVDDDDATAGDAIGVDVVIISSSVTPATIGTTFLGVATPIVVFEAFLFDDFQLTSANGEQANATQVTIVDTSHPVAGGQAGTPAVTISPTAQSYGVVAGEGVTIASVVGLPERATAFAFEAGAALATGSAAGRRVGLFPTYSTPQRMTFGGWSIIDAAIAWAAAGAGPPPTNQPPSADAGPDRSAVLTGFTRTLSIVGSVGDDGLPAPPGAVSASWAVAGPGSSSVAEPTSPTTEMTFDKVGTYTATLTADDGEETAADTVTITITEPSNQAPDADAGADQTIVLDGTASPDLAGSVDDDGLPNPPGLVTTTWTVTGPGNASIADPGALATTAAFTELGTYTLRLTADDGTLEDFDVMRVEVIDREPRVTENLLSIWEFVDGAGATVSDGAGSTDLTIADPANVVWSASEATLTITDATVVSSPGGAAAISQAVAASDQLTLEVWITPAEAAPAGAGRIAEIATSPSTRNVVLSQGFWAGDPTDVVATRLRTSADYNNPLDSGTTTITTDLTHVVLRRSADGTETITIDGAVVATRQSPGDLVWDETLPFALANDPGPLGAPWLGTYHLVAVYDRALSDAEVAQNLASGPGRGSAPPPVNQPPAADAGPDLSVQLDGSAATVSLDGSAIDDGLPAPPGQLTTTWAVAGPGSPVVADPASLDTTVQIFQPGLYTATLTVDDGQVTATDTMLIDVISATARVGAGVKALYDFADGSGSTVTDRIGDLDLTIDDVSAVTWNTNNDTLRLREPTIVQSAAPATDLLASLSASGEFTAEAWITPSEANPTQPGRIFELAQSQSERSLAVSQGFWLGGPNDRFETRTQTTGNYNNALNTGPSSVEDRLTHVLLRRTPTGDLELWINGALATERDAVGNLEWESPFPLALGDDPVGGRNWLGIYHLLAVYDRALGDAEICRNHGTGPQPGGGPAAPPSACIEANAATTVTNSPVRFDASLSVDGDGGVLSYAWDFGDGSTGTGAQPEHGFNATGTYAVTVTVTDDEGLTDTASIDVVVLPPPAGTRMRWTQLSSANGDLPVPGEPGPLPQEHTASLVADLDGDGDDDFVIASRKDPGPSVVWYERTAGGWTLRTIESDVLPIEAGGAVGDVDEDGDVDIVLGADSTSGEVWWWENPAPNKNAEWNRYLVFDGTRRQFHDMDFGDFDDDGELELAYWNQKASPARLYVAEIPSDPTASSEWPRTLIYATDEPSEGLAVADIDVDGDDDIVAGGHWFEHNGGFDFTPHPIDASRTFTRIEVADFVPGGRPEVVIDSGDEAGSLRFYRWNGSSWSGEELLPDSLHGHSLRIGDVDDDGNLDILSAEMKLNDNDDAAMRLLYGDGQGGFDVRTVAEGVDSHESRLADLDADGDLDILAKPFNDGTPGVSIFINEGISPFGNWERHVIDDGRPWLAIFMLTGDVDGDGLDDVVTGGWWYRNPGTAGGQWQRIAFGGSLKNVAAIGDIDADGDIDAIGTAGTGLVVNNSFSWAENDGSGAFTIHTNIEAGTGTFPQGAVLTQLEASGPLEVVLAWDNPNPGTVALRVTPNPASGTWAREQVSPVSQGEDISASDIDGDGDTDLFLGTTWLRNDPGSTWTPVTVHVPTSGEPDRNSLVDIDGDGDEDAVVGYGKDPENKLAWYERGADPEAPWTEHLIDSIVSPHSVEAADFDGDGDVDVVAGEHNVDNPSASALYVFENVDGAGNDWERHTVYVGDEHHDAAQLLDVDADGDLDIASTGIFHSRVVIYENVSS